MEHIEVLTAFDQKLIEKLPMIGEQKALEILSQSYALHKDRKNWIPTERRLAILNKMTSLIKERREELALASAKEGGKPLIDSLVEIDRAIDGIKVAIKEMSHLHGTEIPMNLTASSANRMAYTRRDPRGVVIAISAFNHPFNLIIHQVIPAIAVGCPVIIKPSATTPLSCRNIVNLLYEAGLPEQWCQMVLCDNDVAEKLVTDSRISFLTFIGSAKVGWYLRSKLPPGATCALEHGGAAPAIIDKTADLETAIPLLVKGGFYHAGQVCVSVQRIIAHKDIIGEMTEKFVESVKSLKVGDPTSMDTEVGPLILPREVERIDSWVQKAIAGGAKLLCGGKKISDTCYAPTVLMDPPEDCEVSQNEIFGPVVCIYSYDELDAAIELANSLDFAFQASIFSKDLDVTFNAIENLEGLAVMVNDHTAFRVDWMPFGGYKQSGLGVGGIGHTIKDMTIEKMFVIKR